MAKVELTINGKAYKIVCDQGQEAHLRQLAEFVNERVVELGASAGQLGEQSALVMTLLSMADELQKAQTGTERIEQDPSGAENQARLVEALTAGKLEDFANRIEQVAARLKHD